MDGTVLEIGKAQHQLVEALRVAMDFIALGGTRSLALTEVDTQGRTRETLASFDGSHLDAMAESLLSQSKAASKLASMWEGNAPTASRSLRQH